MTKAELLKTIESLPADTPIYFLPSPTAAEYVSVGSVMVVAARDQEPAPQGFSDAGLVMSDELGEPLARGSIVLFPH